MKINHKTLYKNANLRKMLSLCFIVFAMVALKQFKNNILKIKLFTLVNKSNLT